MPDLALIARQPIFDAALKVHAYELLYRAEEEDHAASFDDDSYATSNVVVNTFVELGLDRVVGNKKAFINVGREMLLSRTLSELPSGQVVLEILESVTIDKEIEECLAEHADAGFTLALDDFEYDDESDRLIDLANIVKIDVMALNEATIQDYVKKLRRPGIKLLAEKVETQAEFNTYKAMGFDYFQGYFFSKPTILSNRKLPTDSISTMSLLAQLQNPHVEIEDLDDIVKRDLSLSYKLLRYINSAHFSLSRKIENVREALIYLGLEPIRRWATLFVLAGATKKSNELVNTALIRAYMCENLATQSKQCDPQAFFMVGLFSALDALLDADMRVIVDQLPLGDQTKAALLHHQGTMGDALSCTLAMENWETENVEFIGLAHENITHAYIDALTSAMTLTDTLTMP